MSDDAKLNWLPYKDSSHTGLRANWLNVATGVALTAFGWAAAELHSRGVLLFSFVVGLVLAAALSACYVFAYAMRDSSPVASRLNMVLAAAVLAAFIWSAALVFGSAELREMLIGGAVMAVYNCCLAANVLTRWWPPYGRRTRNFYEL